MASELQKISSFEISRDVELAEAGLMVNKIASQSLFHRYRESKSNNTLSRQDGDLRLFARYLTQSGISIQHTDFTTNPEAWRGVTWGIVAGFVQWQLHEGYAISSINTRLSTIKCYARLATKAGAINKQEGSLIETVSGFSQSQGINVDAKRSLTFLTPQTTILLSTPQAQTLKYEHPNTPQGRRNRLIMCLLLDHGLRASEAIALIHDNINFEEETLRFWRPKTKQWTTHRLTPDTMNALIAYKPFMPIEGSILRGSHKSGTLTDKKLTRITLSRTVQSLGIQVGLYKTNKFNKKVGTLSAHDCRHFCATDMARRGYALRSLMDWFGWSSPSMAMRYIESVDIQIRDKG